MKRVKRSVVTRGWGLGGGLTRPSTEDLEGSEMVLCGTAMEDTCHCAFNKTQAQSEANVNWSSVNNNVSI